MARGDVERRNKRKDKRKENKKHPYRSGGKYRSAHLSSSCSSPSK